MGRLEIQIRHGHDGGSGPVIALIALAVLAAAGGAGHKEVSAVGHVVATVVEVVAWTLAAVVILAVAAGTAYAVARVRAGRRDRDRRTTATVITVTPNRPYTSPDVRTPVRPMPDTSARPIEPPHPNGNVPVPDSVPVRVRTSAPRRDAS